MIYFLAILSLKNSIYRHVAESCLCPCLVGSQVADYLGDDGYNWCLVYLFVCLCGGFVSYCHVIIILFIIEHTLLVLISLLEYSFMLR